jgi:hypothetical protein
MRVNVTTTATTIAGPNVGTSAERVALLIKLKDTASASVFIECRDSSGNNTNATTGAGYELEPGDQIGWELSPGDKLTAIVASGTQELHVARAGG